MAASILLSPAFLISAAITLAAGGYAYAYLPVQMHKAYRQSLLTLATAVETKDKTSVGHGGRVAALVVATAKIMRISRKQWSQMEYAAFLQDLGNVRVPHGILNRADTLTHEEFEIVKVHTSTGADIVGQIGFLKDISPIIRHHHEFWNGTGYPDGMKGERIPLGSRIIAVCTAYDAMTHEKSYRAALGEDEAVKVVRADAGIKYDPAVVDAFLKALKKLAGEERPVS